jgi:hypothetical protein
VAATHVKTPQLFDQLNTHLKSSRSKVSRGLTVRCPPVISYVVLPLCMEEHSHTKESNQDPPTGPLRGWPVGVELGFALPSGFRLMIKRFYFLRKISLLEVQRHKIESLHGGGSFFFSFY